MTEDAGFTEAVEVPAPEAEASAEPAPEPAGPEETPVPDGPPQPATEPEDHVPPPWLPPGQPDWFREMVEGFHARLRHLERG